MKNKITPSDVMNFAKQHGYEKTPEFITDWNGYQVYVPDYSDESGTTFGLPQFILKKDADIKWASEDEQEELMNLDISSI